eukprot:TRINITY_DN2536_c0_g1_i1.p1 TRINITY_DN2536_c0_g1~~TRINITY_DN2536_c0_g1_i1.p1  ORF type:complete len:1585 (-),score=306.80 TRINITY_DN2536_c0_g1_i1:74-4789(-)
MSILISKWSVLLCLWITVVISQTSMITTSQVITVSNYDNNLDVIWNVSIPPVSGAYLQVRVIYFDIEDGYDFLYVQNGDSVIKAITGEGTDEVIPIYADDPQLLLHFQSDGSITGTGFSFFVGYTNCYDGIKNFGETDIDCSGGCEACNRGKNCTVDYDCSSQNCLSGVCSSQDISSEEVRTIPLNGYDRYGICNEMTHDLNLQPFGNYASHLGNFKMPNIEGCTLILSRNSTFTLEFSFDSSVYYIYVTGGTLVWYDDTTGTITSDGNEVVVDFIKDTLPMYSFNRDISLNDPTPPLLFLNENQNFLFSFHTDDTNMAEVCSNVHVVDEDNIQLNVVLSDFAWAGTSSCSFSLQNPFNSVDIPTISNGNLEIVSLSLPYNYLIISQDPDIVGTIQGTFASANPVTTLPFFTVPSTSTFRRTASVPTTMTATSNTLINITQVGVASSYLSIFPEYAGDCDVPQEVDSGECIVMFTSIEPLGSTGSCTMTIVMEIDHVEDPSIYFIFPSLGLTSASGYVTVFVNGLNYISQSLNTFGFPTVVNYNFADSRIYEFNIVFSPGLNGKVIPSTVIIGTRDGLSNCNYEDIDVQIIEDEETELTFDSFGHTILLAPDREKQISLYVSDIDIPYDGYHIIVQSNSELGKYITDFSTSPVVNSDIIVISRRKKLGASNIFPKVTVFDHYRDISTALENSIELYENKMVTTKDYIITIVNNTIQSFSLPDLTKGNFINNPNPLEERTPEKNPGDPPEVFASLSYCTTPYGKEMVIATSYIESDYGRLSVLTELFTEEKFYIPYNPIFGKYVTFDSDCSLMIISASANLLSVLDLTCIESGDSCYSNGLALTEGYMYGIKIYNDTALIAYCRRDGMLFVVIEGLYRDYYYEITADEYECDTSNYITLDMNDKYAIIGISHESRVLVHDIESKTQYCIENTDDQYFGTTLYLTEKSNELMIYGSRLYFFFLSSLVNNSNCYNPTSSIPNRFTYPGEDWSPENSTSYVSSVGVLPIYITETNNSLLILRYATTTTEYERNNLFRTMPFSSEGTYSRYRYLNNTLSWDIDAPCQKGTAKKYPGLSLCDFCEAGTYQPSLGQTECIPCNSSDICPLGSIDPADKETNTKANISESNFYATEEDKGLDELMFASFFPNATETQLGPFFFVICIILIVVLVLILLVIYLPIPGMEDVRSTFKKIIKELDTEKSLEWNEEKKKFEINGSLSGGLYTLGVIILLIGTVSFGINFFNGYKYFDATVQADFTDVNNDRKSYFQPEFTASQEIKDHLTLLESKTLTIYLKIYGYRNYQCEEICNLGTSIVSGNFEVNNSRVCTENTLDPDICTIEWKVHDLIFSETNTFYMELGDLFTERVEIRLETEESKEENADVTVRHSFVSQNILLPVGTEDSILFNVQKTFEMVRIIQNSDAISGDDPVWKLQRLFDPTNHPSEKQRYISRTDYLNTDRSNTLTITITKAKSFVFSREKKIVSDSEVPLQFILLVMAVIGVWDFGFILVKATSTVISTNYKKCKHDKKRKGSTIQLQDMSNSDDSMTDAQKIAALENKVQQILDVVAILQRRVEDM